MTIDREKYVNLEDVKITVPPKWIPVTEQLPGNLNRVLIAKRISPDVTVVDIGRYFDHEKTWYSKNFAIVNVVAWMPLPKSYEEAE